MMSPTIDLVADEYRGNVKAGHLNFDENGSIAMRYSVRSTPALLVFKGRQVVAQKVGAVGKAELKQLLDAHL